MAEDTFISELKQRLETSSTHRTVPSDPLEKALLPVYNRYRNLKGQNVLVMFSGGLDTSYLVHFLSQVVGANVITFTVDVGSTEPREISWAAEQEKVAARAKEMGAAQHIAVDGRKKLAALAMQAVQAEAGLDGGRGHPPASSLSRVVISEEAINAATQNKCAVIMHGSNGLQNNPYRYFNALSHFAKKHGLTVYNSASLSAFHEEIKDVIRTNADPRKPRGTTGAIISLLAKGAEKIPEGSLPSEALLEATPNLDCPMPRELAAKYLELAGHAVKKDIAEGAISTDENLCGNEREEAGLSNVGHRHYPIEVPPQAPVRISIRFAKGLPVALKEASKPWQAMEPLALMEKLNALGYARHIGVFDNSEARPVGTREREVHVSPALTILRHAHYLLRKNILPPYESHLFSALSNDWAALVMEANLYVEPSHAPQRNLRARLDEVFTKLGEKLDGEVTLTLDHGSLKEPQINSVRISDNADATPATTGFVEGYYAAPPVISTDDPASMIKALAGYKQQPHPTERSEDPRRLLHEECLAALQTTFAERTLARRPAVSIKTH